MQRMKTFHCLIVASCLLSIPAPAGPPTVTLLEESSDTFLTDRVRVRPAGQATAGRLQLPGGPVAMARDAHALPVGRRIAVVTRTPREMSVRLLDADGRTVRETTLAADRKIVAYGEAVAAYRPNLHVPGISYNFDIVWAGGTKSFERANRMIHDIHAIDDFLVVSSFDPEGGSMETNVIDDEGEVRWSFERPGTTVPRVAVRGVHAAALYPGEPESAVELSNRESGAVSVLAVPGSMTSLALLTDASGILLWGDHTTTLIDAEARRVLWQTELPASGKPYPTQLAGLTPLATPVGGAVATLARESVAGEAWDVSLFLFDLGDGSIVEQAKLYRDSEAPSSFRRFREGAGERLVLPHRVYEIEALP